MSGPEYRISVTQHTPELVVAELAGEVDMANVDEAREELLGRVAQDARAVVLDLGRLRYIDSAGVRMLFDASEVLSHGGRTLVLAVEPGSSARKILSITKLDTLVPVHDTVAAAAAAALAGARD